MAKIIEGRKFVNIEGDFVVFLIGMRVNNWWKIHKWLPVAMAMPKMIKELGKNKEHGFISAEGWFGRTAIMVQYWRSYEHLIEYSRNKNLNHLPAWKYFNQKIRESNAVGVWHESYKASKGTYENIYVNMPLFGLGKAGSINEAAGINEHATDRMGKVDNR